MKNVGTREGREHNFPEIIIGCSTQSLQVPARTSITLTLKSGRDGAGISCLFRGVTEKDGVDLIEALLPILRQEIDKLSGGKAGWGNEI